MRSSTWTLECLWRQRWHGSITAEGNVGAVDTVLTQDGLDFFRSEMCQWYGIGHVDSAFVFLLEGDVRRFFIEPDAETFQFRLYYSLVGEGFIDIENNENQIARPRDGYDLTTSSLSC